MAKEDDDKGKGALSDEAREEITRTVNAAVTAQLTRKLPEAIKAGIDSSLSPVLERLDKLAGGKGKGAAAAGGEDDDEEDDGAPPVVKGKAGKGGKAKEPDDMLQMRARLKAIEDERVKERNDAAIAKRDGELRELLTGAKVDPLRVKGALAVVATNLKKLDDGSHVWVAQREGYTEDIPVAQGIAEWSKTDEGKAYVAAAQRPGGSGTRVVAGANAGPGGSRGVPQRDPKEAKAERKEQAVAKLFDQVGGILDNGGGD